MDEFTLLVGELFSLPQALPEYGSKSRQASAKRRTCPIALAYGAGHL